MWSVVLLFVVASLQNADAGQRVLIIGDFGDTTTTGIANQERVSVVMSEWCGMYRCDFIIPTGDNFYGGGVVSVDDPRFNTSWRWVYDKPNINALQWYMSLGNHDHNNFADDRELRQVEFGLVESRWYLPWLWYDFVALYDGGISVHFIIFDGMSLVFPKYDWEGELAWFENQLMHSTADWKVIIEHHPPYSAGNYGPGSAVHRDSMVPICERYGVDFFVVGHDHNLQHITKKDPDHDIDYVITGGGGRGLYALNQNHNQTLNSWGFEIKYFGYHHGFTMFDFEKTTAQVDFVNINGDLSYSFTRTK